MKIFIFLALTLSLCSWAQCPNEFSNLKREYDDNGKLIKETFPNGKSIGIDYDEMNRVIEISIEENGSIFYEYDDTNLLHIHRISPSNQIVYTHSYRYNDIGSLFHEELISNLGQILHEKDWNKKFIQTKSPYGEERCEFNSQGLVTTHFLDNKAIQYQYNNCDQLISSTTEKEGLELQYDENGNLTTKTSKQGSCSFEFDEHGRLIKAITDQSKTTYFYDDFSRRIAKKIDQNGKEETETYLYFGSNEIAIYGDAGELKQLRIPGLSFDDNFILPIAIETKDDVYATIHTYQGNLSKLINIRNQEVISIPQIDPFGQNLNEIDSPTPWLFSSKHYDRETNLIYFGSRYYDPEIKEWISPDPFGTLQHPNVYLYCLGNPISYFDPDGKFAFAIPLLNIAWGAGAVITFPAWGTGALITGAGAAVGWATYKVIQKAKDGKQRDGTPKSNGAQNTQFGDAVKEIERQTGKKLSDEDRRKLHDLISGQNYGYHDIVEEGYWLFNE